MRKAILMCAILALCGCAKKSVSGKSGATEPKWPAKDAKAGTLTKDGDITWYAISSAGKLGAVCSDDGKTWWPVRADGGCYEADKPKQKVKELRK